MARSRPYCSLISLRDWLALVTASAEKNLASSLTSAAAAGRAPRQTATSRAGSDRRTEGHMREPPRKELVGRCEGHSASLSLSVGEALPERPEDCPSGRPIRVEAGGGPGGAA